MSNEVLFIKLQWKSKSHYQYFMKGLSYKEMHMGLNQCEKKSSGAEMVICLYKMKEMLVW